MWFFLEGEKMESPGKSPGTLMKTKLNIHVILDPRFKPSPRKSEDNALTTVLPLFQLV